MVSRMLSVQMKGAPDMGALFDSVISAVSIIKAETTQTQRVHHHEVHGALRFASVRLKRDESKTNPKVQLNDRGS